MGTISKARATLEVATALIRQNGKILIARRAEGGSCGGLWEFPGGKLRPGETPEACAARECQEELRVRIRPVSLLAETRYSYPDRDVHLYFFWADLLEGVPWRTVQQELRWETPARLSLYPFCPADRGVLEKLKGLPV